MSFVVDHARQVLDAIVLEPPPRGGARYLGYYYPAFHPQALIVADVPAAGRARVDVHAFTRGLAAALAGGDADACEPLPYTCAGAELSDERAASLRRALDPLLTPAFVAAPPGLGLDGMPLYGAVTREGGETLSFEAWSPVPGTPQHHYFAGLHALAREAIAAPEIQRRLEQIHGYLRLGLPVADLGGAPRHLRIFGRLSIGDGDALRTFLGAAAPEEPVIVDMLEFEGMGAMLFPLFRRADRLGRIAWVARGRVRQILVDAGVRGGHIFGNLEAARAHLRAGDAPSC